MQDLLAGVLSEANALSILEIAGFLGGILYLLLAIRESIWCWICAFTSSCIFAFLFAGSLIYIDAVLQVFYAAMAVYGWRSWHGRKENGDLAVQRWPLRLHLAAILAVAVASLLSGALLETYTAARYPYIDSATTYASFWATFLVARKVLENWWYWLVIDVVSIAIYIERGLEFAALLFAVYVVMIPFGLLAWARSFRAAPA